MKLRHVYVDDGHPGVDAWLLPAAGYIPRTPSLLSWCAENGGMLCNPTNTAAAANLQKHGTVPGHESHQMNFVIGIAS